MVRYENDCNGCPDCIGCGRTNVKHVYCEECGGEIGTQAFEAFNTIMCEDCFEQALLNEFNELDMYEKAEALGIDFKALDTYYIE